MIIDFTLPIIDVDGKPVIDPTSKETATLKLLCVNSLLANYPSEQNLDGTKKAQRFALAMKIHSSNGSGLDMRPEEITELKRIVGMAYMPLLVGRAYEILDPLASS